MFDDGSSRISETVVGQDMKRPASARRQPDTTSKNPRTRYKKSNWLMRLLLALTVVLVVGALGWFLWTNSKDSASSIIDSNKNQAVFFTNGQIYFGKLTIINDDYLQLKDVFYIQSNPTAAENKEDGATQPVAAGDMKLIKLGEEIHGPDDIMVINRDQVLFFENLKNDSQVVKLINEYKSGKD